MDDQLVETLQALLRAFQEEQDRMELHGGRLAAHDPIIAMQLPIRRAIYMARRQAQELELLRELEKVGRSGELTERLARFRNPTALLTPR
jgi:hypothetical protein